MAVDDFHIAGFPQRFQRGCVASMATYVPPPDGDVDVLNGCRDRTLDGKPRKAKGKAWVVDRTSNAKLKVRFFRPFSGDSWIIDLDPGHQYAVAGHPKRNFLWVLSLTRRMDPGVYNGILERLKRQHYDVSGLNTILRPAD